MNIKNLPMKFSLLALVIALCLWATSVLGLREGLDLAGGYSLDFKLRSTGPSAEELRKRVEVLKAELAHEQTDEERKRIEKELDFAKSHLDQQADSPRAASQRLDEAVIILGERLNPNGLLSVEILPLPDIGGIRIRMPVAKEGARLAEEAFRHAMETLREGNISSGQARRVKAVENPAALAELIERLSAGNVRRAEALGAMVEAYQAELQARAALAAAPDGNARREARIALDDAIYKYDKRLRAVMATNVNVDELRQVLNDNYVTRRQLRQLGKQADGEEKIRTRGEALKQYRAGLEENFPARTEQIQAAVDRYSEWAEQRRTLGDADDVISIIARAGVLEFRIAPFSPFVGELPGEQAEDILPEAEHERLKALLATEGPEGLSWQGEDYRWLQIQEGQKFPNLIVEPYLSQKYLLVYDRPDKVMLADHTRTGWQLEEARQDRDENGQPIVAFKLDTEGGRRMRNLTGRHVERHMAIVLDDVAYSAPSIRTSIGDRGQITGVDPEEIPDLVRTLQAGWLALDPDPVSQNRFGPAIGQDNKDRGFRAAVWGMIAVASFMLVYYLLAGGIADVALVVNIIMVLGFMSLFQVNLTLPGIAGLILTIGIAVDANVLIFERLREEQTKGQSPAMTIKNAYQRAFSAIFDANITTLITCAILGWVGTEKIRGFAIVLGLGVTFSMFTSLVVTRWIFQALLNRRLITGGVRMLQIVGTPKVNWIAKRHLFWGLSIAMIMLGIASLARQGADVLGIEFSAGTQMTIELKPDAMIVDGDGRPALPDDGLLRAAIAAQAGKRGAEADKLLATARVEQRLTPTREAVRQFLSAAVERSLTTSQAAEAGRIARDQWQGDADFFNAIDADGDGAMTQEELVDNLPASTYQLTTTETDEDLIVDVINRSVGNVLHQDPACDFEFVTGQYDQALGLTLAAEALTRVQPVRASDYRNQLKEFDEGVVFKIGDLSIPLGEAGLLERIELMRYRPGFENRPLAETLVIGLTRAGDGLFDSFLVFSRPADETAGDWENFAQGEKDLLAAAMSRQEMMRTHHGPEIARQAKGLALMAIILSGVAIVLYLWLRFGSIQWGLAAVICLAHDVIIVVGMVAASSWLKGSAVGQALGIQSFKIDIPMIGAFLTVIGYSVNDTIVVFDRIRENRGKLTALTPQIINRSINQTLSRTLLTSTTTLIVVVIMYVAGGPGIHAFSYALLVGVLFGTYSSVAIASPLLLGFKKALMTRQIDDNPQAGK